MLLPYLDGERTPNLPDATGTLAGLRSDTEPAQLARAAYEGVVCGLLDAFDALGDAGVATDGGACIVVGGGARSPVYPQLIADLLQRQVVVPATAEYVARGACVQAAAALAGRDVATVAREWAPTDGRTRRSRSRPSTRPPCARPVPTTCSNALIPNQETEREPHLLQRRLAGPPEGERLHGAGRRRRPTVGGGATAPRRDDRWDAGPSGEPANGYFPGGVWEYQKTFVVPETDRGKRILVEFEGVYRGAAVCVNGTLVGHRPYGYSNFAVSIGEHLRYGDENTIAVEATAHRDSRWYSGAGIYRDVHLVVGEPVHIALDGVHVTTPDVDDDGAVIAVATVVENDSTVTATTSVTTEIVDDTGTVVASDVAPLTVFPGRPETLRQRLFVAQPRRWSVDQPALYACRTVVAERRWRARPRVDRVRHPHHLRRRRAWAAHQR